MIRPVRSHLRRSGFLLALCCAGLMPGAHSAGGEPPSVQRIEGEIRGSDHETYRAVEFVVPPGIERLDIDFSHDGAGMRTVVDLALHGPAGFRGASGSNKTSITVGPDDATPSYRPGPIEPGTWRLVLGLPNVRSVVGGGAGRSAPPTRFIATVRMHTASAALPVSAFAPGALREGAAWYRGDVHSHTAHSDGSCASRMGRRVPCPAFVTVAAAAREGLDFLFVTEHNTTSHLSFLRELQPYFDDLLLVPGMELTSFGGHANLIGAADASRLLRPGGGASDVAEEFRRVRERGGFVVVNHPGLPSNEDCMGCGWRNPIDWSTVDAVEIVNGGSLLRFGSAEGPFSALAFWERLLDRGARLTAVAGSDSHDPAATPDRQVPVGRPRTAVFAESLSQRDVLAGLRAGRAFVDVEGSRTRIVDLRVLSDGQATAMGSTIALARGAALEVEVIVRDAPGAEVHLIRGDDGTHREAARLRVESRDALLRHATTASGCTGWIRADVRGADGALLLVSNPIYLSSAIEQTPPCKGGAANR